MDRSTTGPGLGPLPFDAGVLGAPGCQIRCSADATHLVSVDASGRASQVIPVPTDPALAGYECYGQSASTSGGNMLGFAASDAVAIRVR